LVLSSSLKREIIISFGFIKIESTSVVLVELPAIARAWCSKRSQLTIIAQPKAIKLPVFSATSRVC
jgi:hypothetical protein